jgi:hypothetical protein
MLLSRISLWNNSQSIMKTGLEPHLCSQNYWAFGLFQSSSILENREHDISETGSVSVLLQWLRLAFSKGPNWVSSPLFISGRKQIHFPRRRVPCSVKYRTIEKVQKPSYSVCYTPSSESFRIHICAVWLSIVNSTNKAERITWRITDVSSIR